MDFLHRIPATDFLSDIILGVRSKFYIPKVIIVISKKNVPEIYA